MKILSLFDGMACGMLAMQRAGVEVERYVAFEIDKYAVKTASHNFPMIEQRGDVFTADFTEFVGFDYLVGGSPCTYWSIAQNKNRETEASGMGWELFSQYVRALHEAKPRFFIYENNKSMSKAIRESITSTFGFEPICINSALLSAQNRNRLYWVGRRNEDGTYSKVGVDQPEDRGILLRDILESGGDLTGNDKGYTLTASYDGAVEWNTIERHQRNMVAEPVRIGCYPSPDGTVKNGQAMRLYSIDGKSVNMTAQGGGLGAKTGLYAVPLNPVLVGAMPGSNGELSHSQSAQIYGIDGKSATQCANGGGMGAKTGLYAIPLEPMRVKEATKQGYTEIQPMECVDMQQPNSKTRRGRNMADKSNCLMTSCQYYQYCGVLTYATPCEFDESGNPTKAISAADGKTYPVYLVEDGKITIKGKTYPIKLVDGHYIIRKLTVREGMRLQTVPEWYEFPVSDSQAYKMLGNGWTVEVIAHLIEATKGGREWR